MRLIAITTPHFWDGEAERIERLLTAGGFWRVHIRKPDADEASVRELILSIAPELRQHLTVHYHFGLSHLVGGLHLNARNPVAPEDWHGLVSRSCHSLAELSLPADYRFLSPVFDSISKPGYKAAFAPEDLLGKVDDSTFALGGVTFDNLPLLQKTGFGGVAMLGAAWK